MSLTASAYGFQPISHNSGIPRTVRMPGGIASGYAANIFKYAPITLNATTGVIQATTATTDKIFGIFAGVEYTPVGGRPVESTFWPTGQTYDTTLDMFVYFWPGWDATLRFQVQADGAVAQALMGAQFNVASPTTGNTTTGLSGAGVLHAGVVASSQGQFFLQEFATYAGDAINDAFTDLIVGVAYPQTGNAFQTSIG